MYNKPSLQNLLHVTRSDLVLISETVSLMLLLLSMLHFGLVHILLLYVSMSHLINAF
jgi:hypothetical protein